MKSKVLAPASALFAALVAASAVPGGLASGVTGSGQSAAARRTTAQAARTATTAAARAATAANRGGVPRLISVYSFGNADPDATLIERDPARRRLRAAACHNPGPGGTQYTTTGIRVQGPTTAHFNPAGAPSGAASALQAAFNTWRSAEPAAPPVSVVSDGTVRSATANHRYDLMFAGLGNRTLGVTYTWRYSTGEIESDTVFNANVPWFIAPGEGDGCYEGVARFDVQNTATHEFGHTFGLGHVSAAYETMSTTATTGETYKRSLAPGDINGIRSIY